MTFPTNPLSLDSFGGIKEDYIPVVDPTYDRSAEEVNVAFATIANMTSTCIQATLTFTGGAGPIIPSSHKALWGSSISFIPIIAVTGTGTGTITFPSSFTNEFGEVVSVNITKAYGNLQNTFGFISLTVTSPNVITYKLGSSAGSASNLTSTIIDIWAV